MGGWSRKWVLAVENENLWVNIVESGNGLGAWEGIDCGIIKEGSLPGEETESTRKGQKLSLS
jgi:hypothetical protein